MPGGRADITLVSEIRMTSIAAQPRDIPSTSEGRARYAVLLAALVAAFVIQGVAEPRHGSRCSSPVCRP
jgi:hypothetical protein